MVRLRYSSPALFMPVNEATWHAALARYLERDDLIVDFAHPFLRPTGERVDSVPSVFLRFPQWKGLPIGDDPSKKSPSMIDFEGEALFPELAVLRLLERDGWEGRWILTNKAGEITKYLTEWRDGKRDDQRNRTITTDHARSTLYSVADRSGNRYGGCWSVFAWRGNDLAFFETKRQSPKDKDRLKPAQEAWVRAALSLRQQVLSPRDFVYVQWDFR
jgi:hypothetical protein